MLTKVPFRPFGVTALLGGRWDLVGTTGPSVAVLANRADGVPKLVRQVPLPRGIAIGTHLTPDGKYLLVANGGAGAEVVS